MSEDGTCTLTIEATVSDALFLIEVASVVDQWSVINEDEREPWEN